MLCFLAQPQAPLEMELSHNSERRLQHHDGPSLVRNRTLLSISETIMLVFFHRWIRNIHRLIFTNGMKCPQCCQMTLTRLGKVVRLCRYPPTLRMKGGKCLRYTLIYFLSRTPSGSTVYCRTSFSLLELWLPIPNPSRRNRTARWVISC